MPVTKEEAEIAFQYNIDVGCKEISDKQRFKISQLIKRRDKITKINLPTVHAGSAAAHGGDDRYI